MAPGFLLASYNPSSQLQTPTAQTFAPTVHFDVFLSLRFSEAMDEAVALQTALQDRGLSVFLCDVAPGGDIAQTVIRTLSNCKMAVILGTKTYGQKTKSGFSNFEELRHIINEQKDYFLIKMCDRFEEEETRFRLPPDISYYLWKPVGAARKQVPGDLVEQIVKKHSGVVHSVNVASPAARPSLCPRTSMGCSLQCKVRVVVVLRTTILWFG